MNLIEKIRGYGGRYFLQKGIKNLNRNKKLININKAGSVAVLFELTDKAVYYSVQQYFKKIQTNKIKVKALGYNSNNKLVDSFLPVLSFDLFTSKQLNWFEIPKDPVIQDFLQTDFDICINLASEDVFPLKYIAGLSKARLKVGAYSKEMEKSKYKDLAGIYDIMLLTEDQHNQIVFLDNIHEYLTILNPKENV